MIVTEEPTVRVIEVSPEVETQRVVSEDSRLRALEKQAESVNEKMKMLSSHVQKVEVEKDEARLKLDSVVKELTVAKDELAKVSADLKGCHSRERMYLKENRDLKTCVKTLEDEVKRLDGVALDLENELSAAEIALEKMAASHEGGEFTLAKKEEMQAELEAALSDVAAREWRIDDLVHQVTELREGLAEYHGRVLDAERLNAHLMKALEESETSYHSVVNSSIASLQSMDARVSELKRNVLSKEGSNSLQERTPGSSFGHSNCASHKITPQKNMVLDLEVRFRDLEREYKATKMLCEELKEENSMLKQHDADIHMMELNLRQESRRELERALERIEDESAANLARATETLEKQKEAMATQHQLQMDHISSEKQKLEDQMATMEKKHAQELEEAATTAQRMQGENRKLVKEKEALCSVIEELKNALSLAEEKIGNHARKIADQDKENPILFSNIVPKSPQKMAQHIASPGVALSRGTPLRVLNN
jgi:predicted  nucleic acid-binding Zn-ribbon protein